MAVEISYRSSADGIKPEQLAGFFVGWPHPPTAGTHLRMLQSSAEVVLALDQETDRVVGFVTAITDGILTAYIPLLEVLPAYQKQGIGRELMRRMLSRLENYYMVDLLCDKLLQPFYAAIGMQPGTGMMRRNYGWQSGRVMNISD